ncbi:ISXO2-like transposase domain [Cinara cedri]|uniref:ISXO2-like transposase domain n=1 Tax=Cinara cedri TaxID=506608 RepID=A0A5E4NMJ1_9HEMI|nr:ISXO2-like transposase domain [Cinara cedri]
MNESFFQGKRKYYRGNLRLRNRKPKEKSEEDDVNKNVFFKVENRDRNTLLSIILNEAKRDTTRIHSDKWRTYSTLNEHRFIHKTVNHSENFIDPITGAETQTIETLWRHVKNKYNIKTRGATNIIPSQLQEE